MRNVKVNHETKLYRLQLPSNTYYTPFETISRASEHFQLLFSRCFYFKIE